MSSSEDEANSSDSEQVETLVAGRSRRVNAGNRLSHLLQHLDDEDVKADLLAEDETDQVDYSASEDGDADGGLDSSDDDDEEGPPKEGEELDLQGERELQKQERVETKKKRKARELVRVQPMRKKVKIADTATAEDGTPVIPQAKRRLDILMDHAPTRQSSRSQTVASAVFTEAKLKESRKRAEKTQEVMRIAAEKKAAQAGPALTQADRMARALRIEKVNSRSLNRWEESEQERIRLQKERLEAMRNRKLEGPMIRYWSGGVTWQWREGPDGPVYLKMKYTPPATKLEDLDKVELKKVESAEGVKVNGEKSINEEQKTDGPAAAEFAVQAPAETQTGDNAEDEMQVDRTESLETKPNVDVQAEKEKPPQDQEPKSPAQGKPIEADINPPQASAVETSQKTDTAVPQKTTSQPSDVRPSTESAAQSSFLDGIDNYAIQPETNTTVVPPPPPPHYPSATPEPIFIPLPSMPPHTHIPAHLAPPPLPPQIPASSLPLLRERATRTLLYLSSFPQLENLPSGPTKRATLATASATTNALTALLLPHSHPNFTPEERKYLSTKHRRDQAKRGRDSDLLPAQPSRLLCPLTGKVARFRDPKTGLAYRDVVAYKAVQRVLANGCQWSACLDVWTGIVGEGTLGRVARGVPAGWWKGEVQKKEEKGEGEVKKEGGDGTPDVVMVD